MENKIVILARYLIPPQEGGGEEVDVEPGKLVPHMIPCYPEQNACSALGNMNIDCE